MDETFGHFAELKIDIFVEIRLKMGYNEACEGGRLKWRVQYKN